MDLIQQDRKCYTALQDNYSSAKWNPFVHCQSSINGEDVLRNRLEPQRLKLLSNRNRGVSLSGLNAQPINQGREVLEIETG